MNESDILEAIAGRNSQESGKSLRKKAPRKSHGDWRPVPDRPDPLSLLHAQDEDRLEHLLPIKYGRMMASPSGLWINCRLRLGELRRREKEIKVDRY